MAAFICLAQSTLRITSAYFVPDERFVGYLCDAAKRGVDVQILVPGEHADKRVVQVAGETNYDELLEAGVRIFEYRDTMTHMKVLVVDELWCVLGTTNIDNRSFEHNDEVNVAMRDRALAARLLHDYARDIADSREIGLERWRKRPLWEKIVGPFVWILERQQ
jgi:cardiolipin synthase